MKSHHVTSRIPARKLCCSQQRVSFFGLVCARRRMSDDAVLWLHRGYLKKAMRIVKSEMATKALQRSRPMSEALPREVEQIMLKARLHFDMLMRGAVPDSDEETHDYLCHVIGVAQIRVCDIGLANGKAGIDRANDLLTTLNAAARAMLRARERHQNTGKWRLDGLALDPLRDSLAIYEEVLRASSPMQMKLAQTVRKDRLIEQQTKQNQVLSRI